MDERAGGSPRSSIIGAGSPTAATSRVGRRLLRPPTTADGPRVRGRGACAVTDGENLDLKCSFGLPPEDKEVEQRADEIEEAQDHGQGSWRPGRGRCRPVNAIIGGRVIDDDPFLARHTLQVGEPARRPGLRGRAERARTLIGTTFPLQMGGHSTPRAPRPSPQSKRSVKAIYIHLHQMNMAPSLLSAPNEPTSQSYGRHPTLSP
jgi:hypothetical protein